MMIDNGGAEPSIAYCLQSMLSISIRLNEESGGILWLWILAATEIEWAQEKKLAKKGRGRK